MIRSAVLSLLFLAVAGCTASGTNELFLRHHNREQLRLDQAGVVDLDATRRAVIGTPVVAKNEFDEAIQIDGFGGQGPRVYLRDLRLCAEQFPDVFTVAASQFSASGSGETDGKTGALDFATSLATSETGSSIVRTQTISLLREMMFRTCERYMNGAIGSDELAVQAARDVRAMVSVLAIEQLTGTVTPPASVIGASGQASATSASLRAMAEVLEEKSKAEAGIDSAKQAFDAGWNEDTDCTALASADRPRCEKAQADLVKANRRLETAEQALELTVAAVGQQVSAVANVANLSNENAKALAQLEVERLARVKDVAEVIKEIVLFAYQSADGSVPCEVILMRAANGDGVFKDKDNHQKFLDPCFRIFRGKTPALLQFMGAKNKDDLEALAGFASFSSPESGTGSILDVGRGIDLLLEGSSQGMAQFFQIEPALKEAFPNDVWNSPSSLAAPVSRVEVEYYDDAKKDRAEEVARWFLGKQADSSDADVCVTQGVFSESPGFGEINVSLPTDYAINPDKGPASDSVPVPTCT